MQCNMWLPKGYELPHGSRTCALLHFSEDWQIVDTSGVDNMLISRPQIVRRWNQIGFLAESLFTEIVYEGQTLQYMLSNKKYRLAPVVNDNPPGSKVDALAFALALKASRELSTDISLHDAIYVEQYSRLLPTWTPTPPIEDDVILGTWLTGGVAISTCSFRRLVSLTSRISAGDVLDVIKTAGFSAPTDANILTLRKPVPQTRVETDVISKRIAHSCDQLQDSDKSNEAKIFRLPGRPQIENFFNEHVIDIIFNTPKYQALGINFPSAIVLHGPPGCGKTFAVERLVEFIDWPNYSIDSNSIGSPYIHETSKKISEIFDKAIDNAPSVIIIDEMESFLSDRRSGSATGLHHVEEVAEFLRRIPEAIKSRVLIIAMTNMIESIDPAILRRGRFDHIIEVGMPSRQEVASLIESLLSQLPKECDLNVGLIIDALTGKALSDSAFVIREAARLSAKARKSAIDQESLIEALNSLPDTPKKRSNRIGFFSED
ncbi:MAG: ATP-binding protein [Desulfovibrio sp.]|uniref:ATP-binding protein n=1 Tax=Desulfovibrio sp. TaxID=885 RepID=UPI00135D5F8F|nr:ATP-binding protein [Desulfovibrio sp.]MTJ92900.1 ATP-binding protein [Desulfovibrio sp.]